MITKKKLLDQILYLEQRIELLEWDLAQIKKKKTTKK